VVYDKAYVLGQLSIVIEHTCPMKLASHPQLFRPHFAYLKQLACVRTICKMKLAYALSTP